MSALKEVINAWAVPSRMFTLIALAFFFVFPVNNFFERWNRRLRIDRIWTNTGGMILFGLLTAGFVWGMTDANFRLIVLKPDNLPIVGLIYLAFFFLWLAMSQARVNDQRLERKEKPLEWHDAQEKVLVWPDLVFIELIALVLVLVLLFAWGMAVDAPLEQAANPTSSPNPAKAPWYFLALQEMLVYFDPWLAGVMFPTIIVLGLMAIPYIDSNHRATGYYTFKQRHLAIPIFLFGWLVLWLFMMMVGTVLRGPNWNLFGPFEAWDPHKLQALTNINLSEYIYIIGLGKGLPQNIFVREMWGFVLVGFYLAVIPLFLAKTFFKNLFQKLGALRYSIFVMLMLLGLSLPIKMFLRWAFNLKYIVSIPEFFFNI